MAGHVHGRGVAGRCRQVHVVGGRRVPVVVGGAGGHEDLAQRHDARRRSDAGHADIGTESLDPDRARRPVVGPRIVGAKFGRAGHGEHTDRFGGPSRESDRYCRAGRVAGHGGRLVITRADAQPDVVRLGAGPEVADRASRRDRGARVKNPGRRRDEHAADIAATRPPDDDRTCSLVVGGVRVAGELVEQVTAYGPPTWVASQAGNASPTRVPGTWPFTAASSS